MRGYKTEIVVLCYDKQELTDRLLEGLFEFEFENIDKVTLIDNGSEESKTIEGLNNWSKYSIVPIRVVRIEPNLGFTLGFNFGLRLATEKIAEKKVVFAISNDVRIHGVFIQQAADLLLSARRHLVGNRHIAFDSGWNTFNGKTFDYLEGFFLGATSDGWRDLGYFDPMYAPCDMEDIDLSTTAKKKGYKLVSLNNPNIVHQGAGTYGYNSERESITLRNKEYFRQKWMKE